MSGHLLSLAESERSTAFPWRYTRLEWTPSPAWLTQAAGSWFQTAAGSFFPLVTGTLFFLNYRC